MMMTKQGIQPKVIYLFIFFFLFTTTTQGHVTHTHRLNG